MKKIKTKLTKHNKRNGYSNILNINKELREYKRLCRNKSKKFINYSNWKEYIIQKISEINSPEELNNYKHYLINQQRSYKDIFNRIMSIFIPYITITINQIINIIWKYEDIKETLQNEKIRKYYQIYL